MPAHYMQHIYGVKTQNKCRMENQMLNKNISEIIEKEKELSRLKEEEIIKIMKITGKEYSEASLWLDKLIAINLLPKLNI